MFMSYMLLPTPKKKSMGESSFYLGQQASFRFFISNIYMSDIDFDNDFDKHCLESDFLKAICFRVTNCSQN